jgi:hypothetical protein
MEFTEEDFIELKKKYSLALKEKKKIFTFKSQVLLVDYAKYMIEYLTSKFEKNEKI